MGDALLDESADRSRALLDRALGCVLEQPGRPLDSLGRPGGLVELASGIETIVVGDLHAALGNLEAILRHRGNGRRLAEGSACMLILGDALHDDRPGRLDDMSGSIATLDALSDLLARHPGRVCYLRGNHDGFDGRLRKGGVAQGTAFLRALLAARDVGYVEAARRFFDALPLFAIGEGFVATHAGPPRGGCGRDALIDAAGDPELSSQLAWNRLCVSPRGPGPGEYGPEDLAATLARLRLPPGTHFIVGHNPLRGTGDGSGVWLDALGVARHHIIYSGYGSRAPYLSMRGGRLSVHSAREP